MIPHRLIYFDPNGIARLSSLNLLMFNLHGLHRLGEIGGVSLDMDGISDRECPISNIDGGHPDFTKII